MLCIDGHTFDETRLRGGDTIIDIGCVGFGLARYAASRNLRCIAVDPNPNIEDPSIPGVDFIRGAVVPTTYPGKTIKLYRDDGEEGYTTVRGSDAKSVEVPAIRFSSIISRAGTIGLLKIDCEGAEYALLDEYQSGIADQITIEFHDFLGMNPAGSAYHDKLKARLGRFYDVSDYKTSRTPWPPHDQHYIDCWVHRKEARH